MRVPYSLKNCLVFGPYRPKTEICVLNENCQFKFKIDLDGHGPDHYSTIAILLNPSFFIVHYLYRIA